MRYFIITICFLSLLLSACQEETPAPAETTTEQATEQATEQPEPDPPKPPILEDFQGQPKLSLFPRVGDYQPDPDEERHPYWRTFIDHITKVAGLVRNPEDGNQAWSMRSIKSVDSMAFFSPVAVEPNQVYEVIFRLKAELPEEATAGIGILEFNEFLWIGEQYTEETFQEHFRGHQQGKRLTGNIDMEQHSFNFITGPETRMVHLVLFREGPHSRNAVLFDDIMIDIAED